jgi:tetratricopeptide (TPR) repeat protein
MKRFASICLLLILTIQHGFTDDFTDELQWLAKLTACIGQYNKAQTGDYTVKDPQDYYRPSDIREWLAKQSGSRTVTQTFYGICFDYAQAAYNTISQSPSQYEQLGMRRGGWYIAVVGNNPRQITLYDPVARDKATVIMNGVPLKENSRQNIRAHGDAKNHAWLWVYGNDGTIYWLDPTWTDTSGYVWWGIVRNGEETQIRPSAEYCMVTLPNANSFDYSTSGYANFQRGDYDRAIADFTQVIRLDPNDAWAYNSRGTAYHQKGDSDRALADFTQAIRLNPNDAKAYYDRGVVYHLGKKDSDRAIADYTQAIRLDPNYAWAYTNRGAAYYGKGDLDKAIADYTQGIRLNDADAYFNRGLAYRNKGDYDRAIADFTQRIRLDPNYAGAYNSRGYAYAYKGDYDRALADINQAIRLSPNDANYYDSRGEIYYMKKDYDRSITDYEYALRLDPNFTNAKEMLAKVRRDASSTYNLDRLERARQRQEQLKKR